MKVKFVLNMENPVVNGKEYDSLSFEWIEEVTKKRLMEISAFWIDPSNLLTKKMSGLERVGESILTVEPISDKNK